MGLVILTLCVVVTMRLVVAGVIIVVIMVVDVLAMLVLVVVCVISEMYGVVLINFLLQLEILTVAGPTNGLGKCNDRATIKTLQTLVLRKRIE